MIVGMVSLLMVTALLGADDDVPVRLPGDVLPELGMWALRDEDMSAGGFEAFLDMTGRHSAFGLLTTTLRVSKHELTWQETHTCIKDAAEYARKYGMQTAMDLDVRLARKAFMEAYPDELQGMLRLREVELGDSGESSLTVQSMVLSDHYTGLSDEKYAPVRGKLVRVYSYVTGEGGAQPGTLEDITDQCRVIKADKSEVSVAIPCSDKTRGRTACVMAQFDLLTPDVFAPHLLDFEKNLYKQYAYTGLVGVCKDEWGFPPSKEGTVTHKDYWFSRFYAQAYAQQTKGRDLVADCLLMCLGEVGRETERLWAINTYNELNYRRNGEIEDSHYRATKEVFGKDAAVCTHPTWWPNPDGHEFKKNGLDWWIATRDMTQVDEVTPYCVRTALAKKWPCPLWYNMYYSPEYENYVSEVWSAALAGGRVNYHPLYPLKATRAWRMGGLLTGKLMLANSRVRLLNFITKAPVDSPVAVVFGHACAMNWAGPNYEDVGLGLTNSLWKAGYYADLIPSSEIENGSLKVGDDGCVHYGKQRYSAVVLYHPEFEKPSTAEFVKQAARGETALYRVGEWTRGFDGKPLPDTHAIPENVRAVKSGEECSVAVIEQLKKVGIDPNTPASRSIAWNAATQAPARSGVSRLMDGMRIITSAENSVEGDSIKTSVTIDGHTAAIDAVGIVGIRLSADGSLDALAAGGLKSIKVGEFGLELPDRIDIALWRDGSGEFHGVIQHPKPVKDSELVVPEELMAVTKDWRKLAVPRPLVDTSKYE